MRLINADDLIPMMKYATTDNEIGVFPIMIGFNAIKRVIDDAPTIDAVKVVRCKDCEYRNEDGTCDCDSLYMQMEGDLIGVEFAPYAGFYCKFGKHREDGEA